MARNLATPLPGEIAESFRLALHQLCIGPALQLPKTCRKLQLAQCRQTCSHRKLGWSCFPGFVSALEVRCAPCDNRCQLAFGHSDLFQHACIECELGAIVAGHLYPGVTHLERFATLAHITQHTREMQWMRAIEENIEDYECAEAPLPLVIADDDAGDMCASGHGAGVCASSASSTVVLGSAAQGLSAEQQMIIEANRQKALAKKRAISAGPYQK